MAETNEDMIKGTKLQVTYFDFRRHFEVKNYLNLLSAAGRTVSL